MYKETLANAVFKKIRHRRYYEINEFDINKGSKKTLLVEKFIMNKGLYLRVDSLRFKPFIKWYEWKMKPMCVMFYETDSFDIHVLPAGKVILIKHHGIITAKS